MTDPREVAVGVAHLTLLELTPPELVSTAAAAGYDFVGVRVRPATPGERQYPMAPGSAMSDETLRRLDDTGLVVRDVEFLPLGPDTGPDDWLPALEAGAALKASTLSVVGVDRNRARLIATLARLVEDARPFGILPTVEPISFQPVHRVADAAALAAATGAALLLDALHVQRGGSSLDDVRALPADLVAMAQVCDGPLAAPTRLEAPARLPLGMTADGSPLQLEARALRQVCGEGEFPLRDLLGALPPATPLSVEVPDARLQSTMPALDWAVRNREAVRRLLSPAPGTAGTGR